MEKLENGGVLWRLLEFLKHQTKTPSPHKQLHNKHICHLFKLRNKAIPIKLI